MREARKLVEVKNLTKSFHVDRDLLHAVVDLSFDIFQGETLGLVGESGCGKSTVGRLLLRLLEPTSGSVHFNGQDLSTLSRETVRAFRRQAQIIFQDPYASLNPRMSAGDLIAEPFEIHRVRDVDVDAEVESLLELVGLKREHSGRYPHEFSGGQRQRIGIARALALRPSFIVCDEPISALDVSVQAQIINLLKKLQEERGLTYLFIAHDLCLVKYLSTRVAVMYLGHLMELAPSAELYANPLHPYTIALLSAIPIPDPKLERQKKRILLQGEIPSPISPPKGCPFVSRCPHAHARCHEVAPSLREVGSGHFVACHLIN